MIQIESQKVLKLTVEVHPVSTTQVECQKKALHIYYRIKFVK